MLRSCEYGCNGCDECTDWDEPVAADDPHEPARRLGLDLSRIYVNTAEKFDDVLDAAIAAQGADHE